VRRARYNPRRALHSPAVACARQSPMERPWRHGEQGRNVVARSGAREKGPKVRHGPLRLGRARAGVHNCTGAASLHRRVHERERAGAGPRRWPGAATHGMAAQGTKKRNKATTRARWSWQQHLQEKTSQPGLKAGITSGGGAVVRYERRVPPRLEGRGVHRWQGKLVLTLVATGRSAGAGEEGRHGSSVRRKKTASWQR
jgi:hypothetical protein